MKKIIWYFDLNYDIPFLISLIAIVSCIINLSVEKLWVSISLGYSLYVNNSLNKHKINTIRFHITFFFKSILPSSNMKALFDRFNNDISKFDIYSIFAAKSIKMLINQPTYIFKSILYIPVEIALQVLLFGTKIN